MALKVTRDFKFWKKNCCTLTYESTIPGCKLLVHDCERLWHTGSFLMCSKKKKKNWLGKVKWQHETEFSSQTRELSSLGAVYSINSTILWDVMPCTLVQIYHFRGTCYLSLLPFKMEIAGSSEVSTLGPIVVFCCIKIHTINVLKYCVKLCEILILYWWWSTVWTDIVKI